MAKMRSAAGKKEHETMRIAPLFSILIAVLFLMESPVMARQIRQERFSLLSESVRLADQETFFLTSTSQHRQLACEERIAITTLACWLPVVHFQLDSAELSETERASLITALAQCAIAPGTGLIVTGHTCLQGTEAHNRILSQRRAEKVAKVLRTHGYTVSAVTGIGAQAPLPGNKQLANNRRVELTFTQP
jgi:outer membrane protein OmpA-like peptidoglycan-associated protein